VLVTGGCGFIGSHTARKLLTDGFRVICVDEMNDYYDPAIKFSNLRELRELSKEVTVAMQREGAMQGAKHVKVWSEFERFVYYKCDVADQEQLGYIFEKEKPTLVCHLAARAGVRYSIQNPLSYTHSNVTATVVLFELCVKYNVRSISMASSSSVYGDRPTEEQKDWNKDSRVNEDAETFEEDEMENALADQMDGVELEQDEVPGAFRESDLINKPESPYAATKAACELLGFTYNKLYNIPIAMLRFFTVYGPGGRPDMAPYKFIRLIHAGKPIDRYGDGSAIRDFTYVSDIVDGIVLALLKPQGYQIYNLGGGRPISLSRFISICEEAVGKKAEINVKPTQPGDVARTHASVHKANKMLGFRAKVEVTDGMKRMADWYKSFLERQTINADDGTEPELQPSEDDQKRAEAAQDRTIHAHPPVGCATVSPGVHSSKHSDKTETTDVDSGLCDSSVRSIDTQSLSSLTSSSRAEDICVCTRIHSMKQLGEMRISQLNHFVRSVLSLPMGSHACVAVEVVPAEGESGFRLYNEVMRIAKGAALNARERERVCVLPVAQWGITTALNACVHKASDLVVSYIAFASLEVGINDAIMSTLVRECDVDDTLVAGLALDGHQFSETQEAHEASSGVSVPWNTLSVWNSVRLCAIGFVAIGNGSTLLGTDSGMEEMSTISVIQQLRQSSGDAQAKLVRIKTDTNNKSKKGEQVRWDTAFTTQGGASDRESMERQAKHVVKMRSKNARADAHMQVLDLPRASVMHLVVDLAAC